MVFEVFFIDYDGDNDKDLLLVGEWMVLIFFNNNGGVFLKDIVVIGLENLEGWWFSVFEVDFDGDGDVDYILGNLGVNNKFYFLKKKFLYILVKDFDNNGIFDVVMSKISNGKVVFVRGKECSL